MMMRAALGMLLPPLLPLFALTGTTPAEPTNDVEDTRPNVVVVFTDDMRKDELRFMPRTRQLIGARGATFDRAYANNALCCPFRATLVTGQHSHNNGVYSNKAEYFGGVTALDDTRTLFPALQENGYQTGYIGKWLNGYQNTTRVPPGIDEWHVPVGGTYRYYRGSTLQRAPMGDDAAFRYTGGRAVNHNGVITQEKGYVAGLYSRFTDETVRTFSATDQPFFLSVSHLAPHTRSTPDGFRPPEPEDRYRGTVPRRSFAIDEEADVSDKPRWIRRLPELTRAERRRVLRIRALRAESLRSVDDTVGDLVDTLAETGELDNTIIAFTSDNGYMQGEHRLTRGKVLPYEPSAGIPLLVRGPGFDPGTRVDAPVGSVDLGATVLDVSGTEAPFAVDGISLRTPDRGRQMILEGGARLMEGVMAPAERSFTALVSRRWKIVRYFDGSTELYTMRGTRGEKSSVHRARRDVTRRLMVDLRRLRDCAGAACNS